MAYDYFFFFFNFLSIALKGDQVKSVFKNSVYHVTAWEIAVSCTRPILWWYGQDSYGPIKDADLHSSLQRSISKRNNTQIEYLFLFSTKVFRANWKIFCFSTLPFSLNRVYLLSVFF